MALSIVRQPEYSRFLEIYFSPTEAGDGFFRVSNRESYSPTKASRYNVLMRYSLRSMMIAVTLICVVLGLLGARIEYLRRQAEFYKQEAKTLEAIILASPHPQSESVKRRFGIRYNWYGQLSKQYRQAMYRPWITVDDAPPKHLELEKWPDGKVPRSVFADP